MHFKNHICFQCYEKILVSSYNFLLVQDHEVHQKILMTGIGSKNTPDLRKMSSEKLKDHHNGVDEEFYLSLGSPVLSNAKPSVSTNAQKRETYTFENSVNMLPSNTEILLKTKKR